MEKENQQKIEEFNFDLPKVEGAPATKPRIFYAGESVCTSCEG